MSPEAATKPGRPRPTSVGGAEQSGTGNGAALERLVRMSDACQALSKELTSVRRQLKAVEAELREIKQQPGKG